MTSTLGHPNHNIENFCRPPLLPKLSLKVRSGDLILSCAYIAMYCLSNKLLKLLIASFCTPLRFLLHTLSMWSNNPGKISILWFIHDFFCLVPLLLIQLSLVYNFYTQKKKFLDWYHVFNDCPIMFYQSIPIFWFFFQSSKKLAVPEYTYSNRNKVQRVYLCPCYLRWLQ